jgi:hypothetical protein
MVYMMRHKEYGDYAHPESEAHLPELEPHQWAASEEEGRGAQETWNYSTSLNLN